MNHTELRKMLLADEVIQLSHQYCEAKKKLIRDLPNWNPDEMAYILGADRYRKFFSLMTPLSFEDFLSQITTMAEGYAPVVTGLQPLECRKVAEWCEITVRDTIEEATKFLLDAYCTTKYQGRKPR